jgi:hypothetical protein
MMEFGPRRVPGGAPDLRSAYHSTALTLNHVRAAELSDPSLITSAHRSAAL